MCGRLYDLVSVSASKFGFTATPTDYEHSLLDFLLFAVVLLALVASGLLNENECDWYNSLCQLLVLTREQRQQCEVDTM